jgi:hypothetical protein
MLSLDSSGDNNGFYQVYWLQRRMATGRIACHLGSEPCVADQKSLPVTTCKGSQSGSEEEP